MTELAVGDFVRVSASQFSKVVMFTHRDAEVTSQFVVLSTELAAPLRLSPGHYVYANGKLVTARTVKAGDVLTTSAGDKAVKSVRIESAKGLFNPQTEHGDIVVNGVKTSTFTDAVSPKLASAVMWGLSALDKLGVSVDSSRWNKGAGDIASAVASIGLSGAQQYEQ
jgi:hypothetical protein